MVAVVEEVVDDSDDLRVVIVVLVDLAVDVAALAESVMTVLNDLALRHEKMILDFLKMVGKNESLHLTEVDEVPLEIDLNADLRLVSDEVLVRVLKVKNDRLEMNDQSDDLARLEQERTNLELDVRRVVAVADSSEDAQLDVEKLVVLADARSDLLVNDRLFKAKKGRKALFCLFSGGCRSFTELLFSIMMHVLWRLFLLTFLPGTIIVTCPIFSNQSKLKPTKA